MHKKIMDFEHPTHSGWGWRKID